MGVDDKHRHDTSAQGKTAVNGHIGDVEQTERDEHAEHHDAPEDALRDGALQCDGHAMCLLM